LSAAKTGAPTSAAIKARVPMPLPTFLLRAL
jgi:hypothetical protein